jgi:methylenetetrahydrofolate dehydrogenase (NADP+)/methenyltetrahydrofolate cyclohydrolase
MKIFNGKKVAKKILLDLKRRLKKEKRKSKLAVISIGEDPASNLFIRNKKQAARKIGIRVNHYKFKKSTKEKEIIKKINDLNKDPSVNGIIVQLPLPKGFNTGKIIGEIHPQKDVDGFHKKTYFSSPLISAISIALKDSTKNFKNPKGKKVSYGAGKKIIALVNSDIFGETLKNFLKRKKIKINYLLRKKIPLLKLRSRLKSSDIIITVCGCPNFIKGNMIKKGVILIDGGITVLKNKKVVGDVDRKSVEDKASFLTPVPGGIGPLTVALLLKNVYLAKKHGKYR